MPRVLHLVMPRKTFNVLSIEINKVRNAIMIFQYADCTNSREQGSRAVRIIYLCAFKKEIIESV
jgi:hypothetical protein